MNIFYKKNLEIVSQQSFYSKTLPTCDQTPTSPTCWAVDLDTMLQWNFSNSEEYSVTAMWCAGPTFSTNTLLNVQQTFTEKYRNLALINGSLIYQNKCNMSLESLILYHADLHFLSIDIKEESVRARELSNSKLTKQSHGLALFWSWC